MNFAPVYSSSDGNMYLFEKDETAIMVDMGVAGSHILTQCQRFLGDLSKLQGIFLTHAHGDHCDGLLVFLDNYEEAMAKEGKTPNLSIYATATCIKQVKHHFEKDTLAYFNTQKTEARERYEGDALEERLRTLQTRQRERTAKHQEFYATYLQELSGAVQMEPFQIQPFKVSHDTECHGYRITAEETSAAVCIDLGSWDKKVLEALTGVQLLLLEANYHEPLLKKAYKGPQCKALRNRILGAFGHLSNEDAIALAVKLHQSALHTVIFGHMSSKSNTKEQLQKTITATLGETPPFQLCIAPGDKEIGDCWYQVATGERTPL